MSGQTFLEVFTSELEALGGYTIAQAEVIAKILQPDVLTFGFSSTVRMGRARPGWECLSG